MNMPFTGTKIALLIHDQIITLLRDDRPDIPYPGYWDLPGGGRETGETPVQCMQRETREEVGLVVPDDVICWARRFVVGAQQSWFFVAHMPRGTENYVRFGNEGQGWKLMQVEDFLHHPKAVPEFQERLRIFLTEAGK